MEEQIASSQVPPQSQPFPPGAGSISPDQLEEMKARAREAAIRMTIEQRQFSAPPQSQVVYVRRNLTVAELLLILLLSCGLVTAVQAGWNFGTKFLPRLEIKVK